MDATNLRDKALAATSEIDWYPSWAINRMRAMIEGRPDWCISRQRSWGVPVPVFKCGKCGSTIATSATFDAVINLFEQHGADAWYDRLPAAYLPEDTHCEVCKAGIADVLAESDILDVWWESGASHTSVLKARDYLQFPADLYLEGSDQHRGWFQSSLLTSVGAYDQAPYKAIMSCGFVNDGDGNKMSKSKGNVIDPLKVMDTYGADILRLWVASIDYSQDVGIDNEILKRTSEAYRRIRNSFRFLLSNLYDFSYDDIVKWDQLHQLDRWALARIMQISEQTSASYEALRFHQVYHNLYDYLVTELSAVYMDALKDRLYSDAANSVQRRSAQTVLINILDVLVRQFAPILSFTCDEVFESYPKGLKRADHPDAIMLAQWYNVEKFLPQVPLNEYDTLLGEYQLVLTLREIVTKQLEEARGSKLIGKSQEAAIELRVDEDTAITLGNLSANTLEELFIVASVTVVADASLASVNEATAHVNAASAEKCPRCWNIRELGSNSCYPNVCERCANVLAALGFKEETI
ncbi:MAG: class I tRNA ligase family protein, partial [Coriobacteriales bacterium]|jgi:isoleucyl-tRNA synthetase|nr:class I tRNA ligase family protein [Coriobacteriales bacterium]